jgi:hypothetical protein
MYFFYFYNYFAVYLGKRNNVIKLYTDDNRNNQVLVNPVITNPRQYSSTSSAKKQEYKNLLDNIQNT